MNLFSGDWAPAHGAGHAAETGELPATGERAAENATGIPCIHLHAGTGQTSFLGHFFVRRAPPIQNFHHNKTGTSGWREWVGIFGTPTDGERLWITLNSMKPKTHQYFLFNIFVNTSLLKRLCVQHPTFPVLRNLLQMRVKSLLVLCYICSLFPCSDHVCYNCLWSSNDIF